MKKCYFAYTWDDNDTKLPAFLSFLKDEIETESEGEIQVIFDKESFQTGDDYEKKEKLIYSCDSIVIFFSPNYKRVVEERDERRGVYREYKKIIEVKTKGIAGIVPVIVVGNEMNAITIEFKKILQKLLMLMKFMRKGKIK